MPISDNITAVNAVLKLLYKSGVPSATYNKQALLNKMKVSADFTGEKKVLAIQTSNPQGFGSSFDRAYANASSVESYSRWQLFRVQHYGFARVSGEVMRTAVDPGALVNVWKNRTQSVVRGMHNSMGRLIYGSGTGKIGVVGGYVDPGTGAAVYADVPAGKSAVTLILQTAADIANFEAGASGTSMSITAYDTYAAGAPQGAGDSFLALHVTVADGTSKTDAALTTGGVVDYSTVANTVVAVNRDVANNLATVTFSKPWCSVAGGAGGLALKVGAILTRDGDGIIAAAGATSTYDGGSGYGPRAPAGVEQWISGSLIGSGPYGNTLFGLDRSSDKLRLGGQVYNGAGINMVEALQTLEANILFQGVGYPDVIVVNPIDFGNLKKSALSDVLRIPAQDPKQNLNFQEMIFMGQNGPIPFVQDPFCPRNKAYMLKMDTWSLNTAPGGMFQLVDWDGVNYLRLTNQDTYEARFASYFQTGCDNPACNGYIYNWGA